MAEKDLWATMRERVKRHGHFERIENMIGRGRPDVNYCVQGREGNIELKWAERWPARNGVLALPHYTPIQRAWARTRRSAGGIVWVLLEVEKPTREYFLFPSAWAEGWLGLSATRSDCLDAARARGLGKFPTDEIITALLDQ